MFFVYLVLRPVAARLLGPTQRFPLWQQCVKLFFKWVWPTRLILFVTGLWMIHNMGWTSAVNEQDWIASGKAFEQIRRLIPINLTTGLVVIVIGTGGRYW